MSRNNLYKNEFIAYDWEILLNKYYKFMLYNILSKYNIFEI